MRIIIGVVGLTPLALREGVTDWEWDTEPRREGAGLDRLRESLFFPSIAFAVDCERAFGSDPRDFFPEASWLGLRGTR